MDPGHSAPAVAERLIVEIERTGAAMKPPLDPGIVVELRSVLGLRGAD